MIYLNNNPHFPIARERPFKVVEPIFEKLFHDGEIRLITWPRGRRDCSMAKGRVKIRVYTGVFVLL